MARESVTQFKKKLGLKRVAKGLSKPYMSSAELKEAADYAAGNRLHLSDSFTRKGIRDLRNDQREALETFTEAYKNMVQKLRETTRAQTDLIIKTLEKKPTFEGDQDNVVIVNVNALLIISQAIDTMYHETSTAYRNLVAELEKVRLLTDRTSMLKADSDPSLKRLFQISNFLSTAPDASELDKLFQEDPLESSTNYLLPAINKLGTTRGEVPRHKQYSKVLLIMSKRLVDVATAYSLYFDLQGPIAVTGFTEGRGGALFVASGGDSLPSMEKHLIKLIDTMRVTISEDLREMSEGAAADAIDDIKAEAPRNKTRETRETFGTFKRTLKTFSNQLTRHISLL